MSAVADWPEVGRHVANMAQKAGLCLRPRDAASAPGTPTTFEWQLVDGFEEVAHGPLDDLDRYLREGGDA